MAAPNMAGLTTVTGKSVIAALTTSAATIINNAAASGTVVKVNSLYVSNVDGTNAATVTIGVYPEDDIGGTPRYLAKVISIPAGSTLIVVSKETYLYLEEDESIGGLASADGDLEVVAAYEVIS